jgi:GAF domain-containing protein
VISSSPTDIQPVLDAVAESAARLCEATDAVIALRRADTFGFAAHHGTIPITGTRALTRETVAGRAILEGQQFHIRDLQSEIEEFPQGSAFAKQFGYRTMLATPLMREGSAIGAILVRRTEARPFSEAHLALVRTFADQAVIAIENVRLFNETKEALEQQTATADILRVISSSPTDIQPVLQAVAESAAHLCDAANVHIRLVDGDLMRIVVQIGDIPIPAVAMAQPITRKSAPGRAIIERKTVHIHDVTDSSVRAEFPEAPFLQQGTAFRTLLVVPLIRESSAVGTISVRRMQMRPFSEQHIKLLETFAAQAMIAIENVRLFNETKEALERQTATAEILHIISRSQTDVQPVFDTIAENALKLCDASFSIVTRFDCELIHVAAISNMLPEAAEAIRKAFPARPSSRGAASRCIQNRAIVHIPDITQDPEYSPTGLAQTANIRSILAVPMLRDGSAVGAIAVSRTEPTTFPEHKVALLKTFADQAVIAIENVRLFNETKEALEQQTATAEILKVISSSPTDMQPVFDAIVQSAARLFEPCVAVITMREGGLVERKARAGPPHSQADREELDRIYPLPLDPERSMAARAILERRMVEILDTEAPEVGEVVRKIGRLAKHRSLVIVPLMRESEAIGAIALTRPEPGFKLSEKQLALIKTFADQAVIAIENVRLFKELQTTNASLREALDQQTATSEILRVISSTPTDAQPVFDAIVRSAAKLCDAAFANMQRFDGEYMHLVGSHNFTTDSLRDFAAQFPMLPDRKWLAGRAVLTRQVVHVADILEDSAFPRALAVSGGWRSMLSVPMLRDGVPMGTITVARARPERFTDTQVDLLKTFADQAVIAIENVRMFNETKEALEQQTAISEILRVISSSPTDVQPVLDAVAQRAARICDARDARIMLVDGDKVRYVAGFGDAPSGFKIGESMPLDRRWGTARAILERTMFHVEDVAALPADEFSISLEIQARTGTRTSIVVPLLRENRALGAIVLRRTEVRPFSDKQIALLKTFADQAAIAIQNVRLFNETKESLDQQKASADVLGVISSSIADTKPVFDKILESCERLFEGQFVGIAVVREDELAHLEAYHGPQPEALRKGFPLPVDSRSAVGVVIRERSVMHYPDVFGDADAPEYLRRNCERTGIRSIIVAPMLWEGQGIGAIFVGRQFLGPFSEKAVRLLKTFADQAVIAIQNARLFREIQEKSAQLEVANKHKSDFLANMSHELRTPLNAIIGFSEALMDRMFGEVNDKQADYLKDIHESGRHLLSLINDILDLSKIEAGRMDLELSSFHLPTALSNAMTLIRERAQRHGIELGLEVDQQLGEFQADERKFKQIMLNLLSNAVKFTPDGGRVDVCAKKDTDKIEIAVKDTGIGIAPEDQAVVFEEFKQVGRDQMRKAEGTGLGLALTRRFVELHGGAIRLESMPGKGSTFTVSLPLRH